MTKKVTSVSLEEDLILTARKYKLNVSEICNNALGDTIAALQGLTKPSDTEREILLRKKEVVLQQLEASEEQIAHIKKRLLEIDNALERYKIAVDEKERSIEIASIMEAVNDKIEMNNYVANLAWKECEREFGQLFKLGDKWDERRFKSHIKMLKNVRGGDLSIG